MSSERELADLSQTPIVTPQQKYDDETELLEAAVGSTAEMEKEFDALIERAGQYEEKLKKGDERKEENKKTAPPSLDPPVSPREVAKKRSEERLEEKKKGKGKGGAFRMSLALMKTQTAAAPPVKPFSEEEGKKEEEGKEEEKTEGKDEKEPKGEEETTPREGTAAQEFPTEKSDDEKMWQKEEDMTFPTQEPPDISDDYHALSMVSTNMEGLNSDLQAIMRQVRDLSDLVKEQHVRLAAMEKDVTTLKEDKSQFQSNTMDDIRALKRQLGNHPPIVASARQVLAPTQDEKATPKTPSPLSEEERMKRLAELRSRSNW